MRRKDREIVGLEAIADIAGRCKVVRLAMVDEGHPYVVPVNFGSAVQNGHLTLYMHSVPEGRKIAILRTNSEVCFEMDCSVEVLRRGDTPCAWTTAYESVIGRVRVQFITSAAEKGAALEIIARANGFTGAIRYNEEALRQICVYKLVAAEVSGKRNLPRDGES